MRNDDNNGNRLPGGAPPAFRGTADSSYGNRAGGGNWQPRQGRGGERRSSYQRHGSDDTTCPPQQRGGGRYRDRNNIRTKYHERDDDSYGNVIEPEEGNSIYREERGGRYSKPSRGYNRNYRQDDTTGNYNHPRKGHDYSSGRREYYDNRSSGNNYNRDNYRGNRYGHNRDGNRTGSESYERPVGRQYRSNKYASSPGSDRWHNKPHYRDGNYQNSHANRNDEPNRLHKRPWQNTRPGRHHVAPGQSMPRGKGNYGNYGQHRGGGSYGRVRNPSQTAHSQMISKLATPDGDIIASKDFNSDKTASTLPVSRLLAEITGLGSRRKIGKMLENGRIVVNGQNMNAGEHILRSSIKLVELDGRNIPITTSAEEQPALRILMYHKGLNELCSRFDIRGRKLIFRNLPQVRGRWISIGRLDYMTSGLLLCTNNGELAQRLMHPSFEIPREYRVRVAGTIDDRIKQTLLDGVEIDGRISKFDKIVINDSGSEDNTLGINSTIDVELHSGRNREVRKLLEQVGLSIIRLRRIRYGDFRLPDNSTPGNTHELSIEDKNKLLQSVGMDTIGS